MSQHDFNIANQSFPATRTDLNNALVALASNSSGASAPSTTYANQFWYETDTNKLQIRNEANSAWIEIATLDQSGNAVQSITTAGLTLGSTAISATGAEINQLDGITRGSILYGNASGATSRLAAGGAGTVLSSDGTDISWAAASGGGGGTEFIASSGAISNAATVDFTAFDSSKYDSYEFRFIDFLPVTDSAEPRAITSSDTSNPSYDTGSSDYNQRLSGASSQVAAYGEIIMATVGNQSSEGLNAIITIHNPHTTKFTKVSTDTGVWVSDQGGPRQTQVNNYSGFVRREEAQVNAIRFYWSSGNIASGEVIMLGIKNA
tara:strand:+ start:8074 stop:9033 length:960 start_codon:yes stop_codon:yes gene_type:complete